MNPIFEIYDEITPNHLEKSIIKELLSQYPPKSPYLQKGNNLMSPLKSQIAGLENEFFFLKQKMETKPSSFLL